MCGRFTMTRDADELALELGVPVESLAGYRPRYNIAPTDEHFIVRMKYEEREALPARWGLVNSWAKDARGAARQVNARAETIATLGPFKAAFSARRCLVPADGFFEWTGPKEARRPTWFHSPRGLLVFAGLYESWQPSPGQWQRTFTIVTTGANELVATVHDRMPVILPPGAADEWLDPRQADPAALRRLLVPALPGVLEARAVSPLVNSVRNDTPEVLEEAPSLENRA